MKEINDTVQHLMNGTLLDMMADSGDLATQYMPSHHVRSGLAANPGWNDTVVEDHIPGTVLDHGPHMEGKIGGQLMTHNHDVTGTAHVTRAHGIEHVMAFHTWYKGEVVLFDSWTIHSLGDLIGSVIGIFILAVLYEGLKCFRNSLNQKSATVKEATEKTSLSGTKRNSCLKLICARGHYLQTFLHLVQLTLSYFLMLIFMTFNVWLCVAVLGGSTVGYFIFSRTVTTVMDITEHCH